ncbi:MAG TPA: diiron oxygenase [Jatrophihabitans sp.]
MTATASRSASSTASARRLPAQDRQTTATRLLLSSIDNSYDPIVDVDWAEDPIAGMPYLPLHRVSLYGTELWERLTPEQRIELSKHEIGSAMQVGLWFEMILMQMLIRYAYDLDPRTAHAQYALTEVGDETRHSIMFARAADKMKIPNYAPPRAIHQLARLYKTIGHGPSMFAPVLVAEEILDRIQREIMDDDNVQPLIRTTSRIHVIEESRHVRYAREELVRMWDECGPAARQYHRAITAVVSYIVVDSITSPQVYRAVGIEPSEGRAAALANPHHQKTRRWALGKIMPFLAEVGIVGGPSTALLRKGYLI